MFSSQNVNQLNTSNGDVIGTPGGKIFSVQRFKQNLQNLIASSASTQPRGYTFAISRKS